jgi:hypothetical protein
MERGTSSRTRGLKMPCGPTRGILISSRKKPWASAALNNTSPYRIFRPENTCNVFEQVTLAAAEESGEHA